MKNTLFRLFAMAALPLACACSSSLFGEGKEEHTAEMGHDQIVLGRQLDDPYSVANVTKALASLYPTKAAQVGSLEPTHYYIRVLPESEAQMEELESLGLNYLDHPMDYEILREGDWYRDPAVEEDRITWLYMALPVDMKLPEGLRYEIIDECYIIGSGAPTKGLEDLDWDSIEREAFRISGNEALAPTKAGTSAVPKGRITVMDDAHDSEPEGLAGVKVCCNVFVKTACCFTDEEGYYEMDKSFSSDPRYRIEFTNKKGFSIGLNLILLKASISTLGKQSASGVNVNITRDLDANMFARAVVNNSAFSYYEGCSNGGLNIKTPPRNLRIWLCRLLDNSACVMMQQGVLLQEGLVKDLLGDYTILAQMFMPDVVIGTAGKTEYSQLYASTVHELSHASHFMLAGGSYWGKYAEFMITTFITSGGITYGVGIEPNAGYCEVGEMWAYYMETLLYAERYPSNPISFGTNHWFYPQIFTFLDNRGLGRFSIFPVLSSDVTDRKLLQEKLISYYPEFKNTINQAFNRYL